MSLLLHINSASEHAYVCLSENDHMLGSMESQFQNEHSAFLQPAIKTLLESANKTISDLAAVSVMNGPGSYTGLRVGLSAAKGICYALGIPLICISTLEWLAHPFKNKGYDLIIPMIDARRMEVFTAGYFPDLRVSFEPKALILNDESFADILDGKPIMFTGNGAQKLSDTIRLSPGIEVTPASSNCESQIALARISLEKKEFAELAYSEPFYLKPFHSFHTK